MKLHTIFVFAAVLLCGACDGRVRSFAPRTSAHGQSDKRARLLAAIREVGAKRGYTEDKSRSNELASGGVIASYSKRLEKRGSVTMELLHSARSDDYRVIIIDWPSIIRSGESKAVEQEIQSKLQGR